MTSIASVSMISGTTTDMRDFNYHPSPRHLRQRICPYQLQMRVASVSQPVYLWGFSAFRSAPLQIDCTSTTRLSCGFSGVSFRHLGSLSISFQNFIWFSDFISRATFLDLLRHDCTLGPLCYTRTHATATALGDYRSTMHARLYCACDTAPVPCVASCGQECQAQSLCTASAGTDPTGPGLRSRQAQPVVNEPNQICAQ